MLFRIVSSLEKVFSDGRGADSPAPSLTLLKGEALSFQLAMKGDQPAQYGWPKIESALPAKIHIRRVESVPAKMPVAPETADENYLSLEPGFYPDVLTEIGDQAVVLPDNSWKSLWIDMEAAPDAAPGTYPMKVSMVNDDGETMAEAETAVTILPAQLPPQTILHTEWFHSDGLANYYDVEVFSEKHWEIIENFVRAAVRGGCNMLLTPHFTPALDTRIGGERKTVQLVDVRCDGGKYSFCFDKLRRWVDMALSCGIRYFEMAHLFTQWGAKAAPKIMGTKDGTFTRLFGWDTPAVGGEYTRFLQSYLPALIAKIREWGIENQVYFHISDEPSAEQLEDYKAAKQSVEGLLQGFPIMDAMSHYEIFAESGIERPVVSISAVDLFVEKKVSPLWGYYCCGPTKIMTNRFLRMPLARTRALGLQLWKYQLEGFLHWGFNFYNTFYSLSSVNPYLDTESGGRFPAGDPFLVYPGPGGKPEESLRLMALRDAMQDARALALLEKLVGREKALKVLEAEGEVTLSQYPWEESSMLRARQRINDAIAEAAKGE